MSIKTRLARAKKQRPAQPCACVKAGFRAYGSREEMLNDPGCPQCGLRPWEIKGVAIKMYVGVSIDDL